MVQVVVIGGGICGLQLAALLARDGNKVTLLEAQEEVGGRVRVIEHNGFHLDFGIHLIRSGCRGPLAKTFRRLGRPLRCRYVRTAYLVDTDGTTTRFPTSPLDLLRQHRLLDRQDMIKALLLFPYLQRSQLACHKRTSLKDWCAAHSVSGNLYKYLSMMAAATLVSSRIDKVPTAYMFKNLRRLIKAGLPPAYPIGGWRHLLGELVSAIEKSGKVCTASRAQHVPIQAGRAMGAVVRNELIPADIVVCALPVQNLFSILSPSDIPPRFHTTCSTLRPTAGISIDYCLDRKLNNERALWFFWQPTMFTLFTSNFEPRLAPHGKQIYTAFSPLEPEEVSDRNTCKLHQMRMEMALSRQWPMLETSIVHKRVLSLTMVDGAEVSVHQLPEERPCAAVPGIENLFLVGDSICAPGGGGDIGHESVHITYRAIRDYVASKGRVGRTGPVNTL